MIVFLAEHSEVARFAPSHLSPDEWWLLGKQQVGSSSLLLGWCLGPPSSSLRGPLLGLALGVDTIVVVRRCQRSGRASIDGVLGGFEADGEGADGAGVLEGFGAGDAGVVAIVVEIVVVVLGNTAAAALGHDAQGGSQRLLDDRLLLSLSGLALRGLGGRGPGGKTRGDDGIFGRFRDGKQILSAVQEFHHGIEGMSSLDGLYYWLCVGCFRFVLGLFCVVEVTAEQSGCRHDCCVCCLFEIRCLAFEYSSLSNVVVGFNSA